MRFLYLAQLLAQQPLLLSYLDHNTNSFLLPLDSITLPINHFLPLWTSTTKFTPLPLHLTLDLAAPLLWNKHHNSQPLLPNAYIKSSPNFNRLIQHNSAVSTIHSPHLNLWRTLQGLQHSFPKSCLLCSILHHSGFFSFVWTETGLFTPRTGPLQAPTTPPYDKADLPLSLEEYLRQTALQTLPRESHLSPLFQGVFDFLTTDSRTSQDLALDRIVHLISNPTPSL